MTLQEQLQAAQSKLKKVPVAKGGEVSQLIEEMDAATGKEAVAAQEAALQQMLEAQPEIGAGLRKVSAKKTPE